MGLVVVVSLALVSAACPGCGRVTISQAGRNCLTINIVGVIIGGGSLIDLVSVVASYGSKHLEDSVSSMLPYCRVLPDPRAMQLSIPWQEADELR